MAIGSTTHFKHSAVSSLLDSVHEPLLGLARRMGFDVPLCFFQRKKKMNDIEAVFADCSVQRSTTGLVQRSVDIECQSLAQLFLQLDKLSHDVNVTVVASNEERRASEIILHVWREGDVVLTSVCLILRK